MTKTLAQQITETLARLRAAKPRSRMRIELELKLRDLRTRQLRRELRAA